MLKAVELMYSSKTKTEINKKMKIFVLAAGSNFALAIMSRIVFELVKPRSNTLK